MTQETHQRDAIVIGAGQGGSPLASALAAAGRTVLLIERDHVGGTCINLGCTPTKTMVASAEVAHLARRAGDYGVEVGSVEVRMERVRARTRDIVETFRNGSRAGLESTDGLELVFGVAELTGPRTVQVTTPGGRTTFEAGTIVLNTGQRPSIPSIDGLAETPYLTNETILDLDYLPEHLVVLGGGYVGLEFGQMFRRFGAEVTIVQRSGHIAPREDEDVAAALTEALEAEGIRVLASAEATRVNGTAAGLRVEIDRDGESEVVQGSHLLVATGRAPRTDGLGLPAAGVETDERGYVRVDERLRTSAEGVYAIGDLTGGAAFTHVSYDDFRVLNDHLLGEGTRTTSERIVPYTLYTDPQLGRVGRTETQARAEGIRVGVAKMPASRVARSLETGRTEGLWKAVVDLDTDRIVGAAILGTEGGEVAALLQVAMLGGVPWTALRDGMFAHPTYAEALNNLFADVRDEA